MTRVILIRHGITEWNQKKRYAGSTDVLLSKKGMAQARRLKAKLGNECIDKIYSSDRKRAQQTARIVFTRKKINLHLGLREIDFGIFEGMTYKEILKKAPGIYKMWLKNPFRVKIPQAETLSGFKKRVVSAFNKIICGNKNKTVAVVCHGGVISVWLNHLLKEKKFWQHIPKAASISIVDYRQGKIKIDAFNDTGHL